LPAGGKKVPWEQIPLPLPEIFSGEKFLIPHDLVRPEALPTISEGSPLSSPKGGEISLEKGN
jgi:hypothetical protein